jgi:hypothetical protein
MSKFVFNHAASILSFALYINKDIVCCRDAEEIKRYNKLIDDHRKEDQKMQRLLQRRDDLRNRANTKV